MNPLNDALTIPHCMLRTGHGPWSAGMSPPRTVIIARQRDFSLNLLVLHEVYFMILRSGTCNSLLRSIWKQEVEVV